MTRPDPLSLEGSVLDGTYRIDSLVGEGGFGVVYRAFHLGFEQPVAVKCLKIPGSLTPQTREAFLRKFREEGKLLFQLSKGTLGIVRSIALGDTTTPTGIWAPYFVLEWLEGHSLAEILKARRAQGFTGRPLDSVVRYLDRPARALAYAHDKRVAHRDIKPANLFVVRDEGQSPVPTIKILDFGIAKAMEDGPADLRKAMTQTGFSSFTPLYGAPEQFDPKIGPTGPWTDVYAFTLLVVEMLTDRRPIEGADAMALMKASLDPTIRPTPRTKGAQVSDSVERVFSRALNIDPALRFSDIGGFWDALKLAVSEGRPQTQTLPSAPPPTGMSMGPLPSQAQLPAYSQSQLPAYSQSQLPAYSQGQLPAMAVSSPTMQSPYGPSTGMPLPTPLSVQAMPGTPIHPAPPTPTTGSASAPILYESPGEPVRRRIWPWLMFGIVIGIALVLALGLATCTTCVCVAI